MGIIETARDIAVLVQKADNIELNQKILVLQEQIRTLLDENYLQKTQIRELREELAFKQAIVFRDNLYVHVNSDGTEEKYCSTCWDADHKAVRIHRLKKGSLYCPRCKKSVPGSGGREPEERLHVPLSTSHTSL